VASRTEVLAVDATESDLRALGNARVAARAPEQPREEKGPPRALWPLAALLGLMLVDYRLTREAH
jgi:hypothetical protein